MFYFIYLDDKEVTDCDGLEKHVKESLKIRKFNFLPHN